MEENLSTTLERRTEIYNALFQYTIFVIPTLSSNYGWRKIPVEGKYREKVKFLGVKGSSLLGGRGRNALDELVKAGNILCRWARMGRKKREREREGKKEKTPR